MGGRIASFFVGSIIFLSCFAFGSVAWFNVLALLTMKARLSGPVATLIWGGLMVAGTIMLVKTVLRRRTIARETGSTPDWRSEVAMLGLAFSPLLYGYCFGKDLL